MMNETNLSRSVRLICAAGFIVGVGAMPQLAMAQQADTGTAPAVQRVEITGSNIRRADAETPSPVQVITADDMKKSGYTSVAQVLQNITANGQGTVSSTAGLSFMQGGSAMSLRGLNSGETLTLIDGHRMAPYPLADNGQYAVVDISNIPFDTIERIEILKDGASAVYGSDAIAGVVNIILKKSFSGTKISLEGGDTQHGGGGTVHGSVISGFGDLDADGYNGYVSLEVRHQNQLTVADRQGEGVWSSGDLTSIGGTNKTPGVVGLNPIPNTLAPYLIPSGGSLSNAYFQPGASCSNAQINSATGCPYVPNIQLSPIVGNVDLLASFTKRLNDGWELNVKASLFAADTRYIQFNQSNAAVYPQSYTQGSSQGGLAFAANQLPTTVGVATIPSINVPANYQNLGLPASNVFGVIPGSPMQESTYDSRAYRLVADLTGSIGEWDIKSSVGYTRVGVEIAAYGAQNTGLLGTMINDGSFNVFGGNSASVMNQIYPTAHANDVSTLEFGELHATRSLMAMAGGDAGFSTGVQYVHREVQAPAPDMVANGTVPGLMIYSSGEQNIAAAYGELVLPVLKTLEIDFAERFDHIDTTGNAITGSGKFKWTPLDSFALRGAASTGFRAPNINEAGNSRSEGYFTPTNDPVYCPNGNANAPGAVTSLNGTNLCSYVPMTITTSSADLKPETSRSLTLGAIFEPIKGWSSTVDLYNIRVNNQIVAPTPQYQTQTPTRSTTPLPGSSATCTGTCPTDIYPILFYSDSYQNANSVMVSGLELGSRYKFKLGDYGTLKTELDWTHTMSYKYTAGGVTYQLAGTHGPSAVSNDTGNAGDRIQSIFTWDKGPLEIATSFNWISSFSILDPSAGQSTCADAASGWFLGATPPSNYCRVASFLDTDLYARYEVSKQWSIHGSINNLFDKAPPIDLETYGNNYIPVNTSLHYAGEVGRMFNVGVTYTF